MRVLSLFSGGGLGDYGLELAGMQIVGQVEIDDYCQKILKLRWPDVPKWRDIRDVRGSEALEKCGAVELISGGFPCQPFSFAGNRKGKEDNRYLWPEMFRVISEVKPTYVIGENVFGIIRTALDEVLSNLESIGYTSQSFVIPACAVDAPHRRDRVWIVGYSNCFRRWKKTESRLDLESNSLDNWKREKSSNRSIQTSSETFKWWETEPGMGRVAHGVANRVDRLKLLGNGQVVQVVEWIGKQIMRFEKEKML